jgi:NAD(P)-dependent dehydrogenase (short-subunit alcohol dehydrogenase family)
VTPDPLLHYQPPPDLLADRALLVTGAAHGIGRAVAIACARHGASLVLVDRDLPALEATDDAIQAAGAPPAILHGMDLEGAAPEHYGELGEAVETQLGRLDGLVSCAAVLGALTPLEYYDPGLWARTLQVDLNAPFLLLQACLPALRRSADASVVLSTADVGRRGRAFWGAYAVANAGLERLVEVLAAELATNTAVRVNSLDPGPAQTWLRRSAYPAENPAALPGPETVTPAYLWLLGPDSRPHTGKGFSAQGQASAASRQETPPGN